MLIFILAACFAVLDAGDAVTYTEDGDTCHFPFRYRGKWYDSCQPYYDKTWCSTTKYYEGSWGYCTDVKPQPPNPADIEARVKGYIDSGTCSRASKSSLCGDLSTHFYKEFQYKGKRVIISSGIPDHPAEDGALKRNPNTRCTIWQFVQLPLAPSKSATGTVSGMGDIGVAVTGAFIFNDLRDPSGALALPEEADTFDYCNGHSSPFKSYHYHANMNCTTSTLLQGTTDPDVCALFGYYYDGVPVYAFCRDSNGKQMTSCYKLKSGRSTVTAKMINGDEITSALERDDYEYSTSDYASGACNLDIANGAIHPTTKQYSYFSTPTYPWIPIYHHAGTAVRPCSAN